MRKLLSWGSLKSLYIMHDKDSRCEGEGCDKKEECLRYIQRNTFSHRSHAVIPSKNACAGRSPDYKLFLQKQEGDFIPEEAGQ